MNKIGQLGEDIACQYLQKHGHSILDRNVWHKVGEIDIVSLKDEVTHFIEVKAQKVHDLQKAGKWFRPEEKVHAHKQKQIRNAVFVYINARNITKWQVDVVMVFICQETRQARVEMLENVIV